MYGIEKFIFLVFILSLVGMEMDKGMAADNVLSLLDQSDVSRVITNKEERAVV